MPTAWLIAIFPVVVIVVAVVGGTIVGRRRGYNFGGDVVVRCSDGHLFTTIWVPGVSLKAIRLERRTAVMARPGPERDQGNRRWLV